jgi:serine/threonine protein kinase
MTRAGRGDPGGLEHTPAEQHFERVGAEQPCGGGTLCKAREKSSGKVVGLQRPAATPAEQERFVAAAQKVKRLWHTHLLRLYVIARDDQGPYAAVEWCEAGSLTERLERGPLPVVEVWALARSLALALEYAHQQGVAHGNVRPSSLLQGSSGVWKLGGASTFAIGAPPRSDEDAVYGPGAFPESADAERRDLLAFGRLVAHAATGVSAANPDPSKLDAPLAEMIRRCVEPGQERGFRTIEDVVRSINESSSGGTLLDSAKKPGPLRSPKSLPTLRASDGETVRTRGTRGSGSAPGTSTRRRGEPSPLPFEALADSYETVGERLEGGMGYVVKCRENATGRVVAVKRVKAIPGQDEVLVQRFLREASNIAKLSHPHVLTLYRAARDDEGDYIVLEWADGGSLKDRLNQLGKLPVAEVIDVARRIGSAIGYAHQKGVIHRDIKPHNILLTEDGTPKLADFGLARGTGDMTITRSTGGAGTPVYMAPEQWISARDADGRSDLCSFGKVLYHLATGEAPVKIVPSKIPLELRSTVLTLVKDRREDRFQSTEQMLAHLERSIRRVRLGRRAVVTIVILVILFVAALSVPPDVAPFLAPLREAVGLKSAR